MTHSDPEELAARAVGDDAHVDRDVQRHLAACTRCRTEFETLRRVVDLARRDVTGADLDRFAVTPPPAVWERIAAATGTAATNAATGTAATNAATGPESEAHGTDRPGAERDGSDGLDVIPAGGRPTPGTDRAPLPARTARVLLPAVAAAALVAAVLGALGGAWWSATQRPTPTVTVTAAPEPTRGSERQIATAALDPVGDTDVRAGRAVMREGSAGRVLEVDVAQVPQPGREHLEVWLLDPRTERMVQLGVLDEATQTFAVPGRLDLAAYPVVDISVEPDDGDPTHSGTSLWRGALSA